MPTRFWNFISKMQRYCGIEPLIMWQIECPMGLPLKNDDFAGAARGVGAGVARADARGGLCVDPRGGDVSDDTVGRQK